MAISAIRVDAATFCVSGNVEGEFAAGRRCRLVQGPDGQASVTILSSAYSALTGLTTVTVDPGEVTVNLATVTLGACTADSVGEHFHSGRGDGGLIAAAGLSEAQIAAVETIPVPITGDAHKIVKVATSYADGYELASLTGTSNQITVTPDTESLVLAAPQDIDSSASPEFAGLTLSDLTGVLFGNGATALDAVSADNPLQVLRRNATDDAYEFAVPSVDDCGDVTVTSAAEGDILYRNGSGQWVNAARGSLGDLLTVVGNIPEWTTPFVADVRLERVDANTLRLTGIVGTSRKITVNGELVDVSSDLTIDTDSSAEFVITGTTTVAKGTALDAYTGGDYAAYGIHYVYVCNSGAAFNLTDYDRRGKLIISAEAPTAAGYLAASGDGVNARCVGAFCLGASRTTESRLSVVSAYNQLATPLQTTGIGSSWDALTLGAANVIPGTPTYVVFWSGDSILASASAAVRNEDTDSCDIVLSIRKAETAAVNAYARASDAGTSTNQVSLGCTCVGLEDAAVVRKYDVSVLPSGADSTPTLRGDTVAFSLLRTRA